MSIVKVAVSFFLAIMFLESIQLNATSSSPNTFWISFAGFHERHFIMKINLFGQVVVKPTRLRELDASPFEDIGNFPKATAISNRSPNTLNVWTYTKDYEIARAVIDKNTLEVRKIRFTNIKSSNPVHLQVTSRSDLNFLAFSQESVDTQYLRGQRITTTGLIEPDSWQISEQSVGGGPTCGFYRCGGGVSADGRMAVLIERSTTKNKIFVQSLGSRGRPNGQPVLIDSIRNLAQQKAILSADASNKVEGGWRAVVYVVNPSGPDEDLASKIFLQKVDSQTGEKLGEKILIARFDDIGGQALAIDPFARFLIISRGLLYYQALDASGHASGQPRVIYDRRSPVGGIDILEDP